MCGQGDVSGDGGTDHILVAGGMKAVHFVIIM